MLEKVSLPYGLQLFLGSLKFPYWISVFNRITIGLILASVAVVILETEPSLAGYSDMFMVLNYFFAGFFTLEYLLRWYQSEDWKYPLTPMAIVDLVALLPFYFMFFSDSFLLRLFRLARLLALAKLGRFSKAHVRIMRAFWKVRYELGVALSLAGFATVLGASLMYMIEGPDQPEAFGSIPRALWWGIVSLTTIGYGDVYPTTLEGKLFTAFYALIAIGFLAVVTAVIVTAVVDSLRVDRDDEYPTEADYREFENGVIEGKKYYHEHAPIVSDDDNPFPIPMDSRRICAYEGWFEGVTVCKRKANKQVVEMHAILDKDFLQDEIKRIEKEKGA